jgi:universal stress protein E
MKQFKNILLCVHPDYTDFAIVDRAATIAANSGAAIKVMHVISDYPEDTREWWNVRNPEKLHAKIVREREEFLQTISERVEQAGVEKVETKLAWGKAFVVACQEVISFSHDLVVVTSRALSRVARLTHECPSLDLFRHCPCTLWIHKRKVGKRHQRIVAALASKRGEVPIEGLNAKILDNAASVAASEGSELHILHALPVYGGKGVKGKQMRSDLVEYLENQRHTIHDAAIAFLGEGAPALPEDQIHLLPGHPINVIPDFVQDRGMDLIVMGSTSTSGLSGMLMGGTAEKVFYQVDCGVLAIKPDDFVSIVTRELQPS